MLDVGMVPLGDVKHQHMNLAPILGEIGGHLFAEKGVGKMDDLHGAGNAVVVGDRDQGHAPGFGRPVDIGGFGEALRAPDLLKNPLGRPPGEFGMDM